MDAILGVLAVQNISIMSCALLSTIFHTSFNCAVAWYMYSWQFVPLTGFTGANPAEVCMIALSGR